MKAADSRRKTEEQMPVRFAGTMSAFVLVMSAATASAQISFSTAVELALRTDPRVKTSEAVVRKAEAAQQQTYDAYIPTVIADGGYGQGFGVPTGLPVVFSLSSQSLIYNFSQRDNVRAATSGLVAAKLNLKETRDQVAEDVAITYLNLDNAQQRQAALLQEYGFAKRLVTIVDERLGAGADTRVELLRARRTSAEIQLLQLQTDDEVAALSDHLARIIGLPNNRLAAVSSSIPALPEVRPLTISDPESYGVKAAIATAKSKLELAFGQARYRLRPQISLGLNYSRIDTGYNNYTQYYPQFSGQSENAESVYLQVRIPLYDRRHQDESNEATAEATRSHFEAESQENLFLEGRLKLQHSTAELAARSELAKIDRDLSQEQLNAVLVQLSSDSGTTGGPQMTPKDEQNARVQERARTVDLLNMEFQLTQAEVSLLRQTGRLSDWLKTATSKADTDVILPAKP